MISLDDRLKKIQNKDIENFLDSSSGKKLVNDVAQVFKNHILYLTSSSYRKSKELNQLKQKQQQLDKSKLTSNNDSTDTHSVNTSNTTRKHQIDGRKSKYGI